LGCSLPRRRSFEKTPSRRSVNVSNIVRSPAAALPTLGGLVYRPIGRGHDGG
jgi:hypothetical protein